MDQQRILAASNKMRMIQNNNEDMKDREIKNLKLKLSKYRVK